MLCGYAYMRERGQARALYPCIRTQVLESVYFKLSQNPIRYFYKQNSRNQRLQPGAQRQGRSSSDRVYGMPYRSLAGGSVNLAPVQCFLESISLDVATADWWDVG